MAQDEPATPLARRLTAQVRGTSDARTAARAPASAPALIPLEGASGS